MNKTLVSLGVFALCSSALVAQITGTVSVGAGYANHKWYSLENGEVGTQSKDNWDLAFEITGFSSAVLANTQKLNFAVYNAPFEIADYSILDTVGITTWPMQYNSDTSWAVGALNKGADLSNPFDLGWGVYDVNTHFVMGDSCFVVKISATSYKKLKIVSLANGAYTFEFADLNGSNSHIQTITKSVYSGKNFVYVDLTSNTIIDREPVSSSWDLMFGRYTGFVNAPAPTPYPVVGIMQNKGVTVAQANNVTSPATFNTWAGETYNTNITTIGHDWKTIDITTSTWKIVNDTVYLVKDKSGSIWKVHPISFGGSANGNYVFSKEKLSASTVGINEAGKAISQVAVYPNPSHGLNTILIFSNEKNQTVSVSIVDINGKVISNSTLETTEGLTTHQLPIQNLEAGIYFVKLNTGSYLTTQKLIIY